MWRELQRCVRCGLASVCSGRSVCLPLERTLTINHGSGEMLPYTIDIVKSRLLHPEEILVQRGTRSTGGLGVATAVRGIDWRLDHPLARQLCPGELAIPFA